MNKSKTIQSKGIKSSASRFDSFIKSQLLKQLKHLQNCCLIIQDSTNSYHFGDETSDLTATIHVNSHDFYNAIAFKGSIGAAEQYMLNNWDTDNLTNLVRVFVRNQDLLDELEGGSAWLKNAVLKIAHYFNKNTQQGSKKNISTHYDLGNELFKTFLDEKMMYSSAIYKTAEDSLEEASDLKLKTICEKLDLQPDDKLIEIGTGWGGLAIYAAKNYGCHVTTTTISEEQYQHAKNLVSKNNLTEKITLLKQDYRELTGTYNKLVSIEMIEAVGHHFLPTYLKKCNDLLTDDGLALIQAITIEDYRYEQALKSVDFIKKYIFPGSFIPSVSEILKVNSASTTMKLFNLEDFGMSYAYTLKAWKERFNNQISTVDNLGYDKQFQRMWNFYFSYCEGGFIERSISVVHLLFTKPRSNRQQILTVI
ncbi:MAG: class I SAM-dependent methyltransferase [Marinicellaceae bacterium]